LPPIARPSRRSSTSRSLSTAACLVDEALLADSSSALLAEGQLVLDLPSAKDMYTRLKNDLIDGISIGYEVPPDGARFNNGVRELHEIKLWEISLVTFPANTFARVTDIKKQNGETLAGVLDSLRRLTVTIRTATPKSRDLTLDALEVEIRKLNNAASIAGKDDPDVIAFAQELQKKIDAASVKGSLDALVKNIQALNRQLSSR